MKNIKFMFYLVKLISNELYNILIKFIICIS